MSVIAHIATAVPKYQYQQSDLAKYMCDWLPWESREKEKLKLMYGRSGIEMRHSVLPDFADQTSQNRFFSKSRNLEERMHLYDQSAPDLCIRAIRECVNEPIRFSDITHLITVSCTGMSAPGLDIDLVQQLGLSTNIHRTSVNFMGCYAAIHALKQADYICQSDINSVVLVVCVELCSLHFQMEDEMDTITANVLFADGAAAALVVSDSVAQRKDLHGFGIRKFHSQLSLNGQKDMAWRLSSTGFLMTLSAYIPQLIENGVKELFENAIQQMGISKDEIVHWAIHPGGRKILDTVQKELNLAPDSLSSSVEILKNYGNMSSPTILFVLKHLWENAVNASKPELTFALAFGPGLTMETVMLENV